VLTVSKEANTEAAEEATIKTEAKERSKTSELQLLIIASGRRLYLNPLKDLTINQKNPKKNQK